MKTKGATISRMLGWNNKKPAMVVFNDVKTEVTSLSADGS
jgi:hypothetical protein